MSAWLIQRWNSIRSSYWFVPSLMAIGAVLLAVLAVAAETWFETKRLVELAWFLKTDPVGARSFLTTVAGSMITVAGVTFSMTVVAVSHASTQLGPRLLGNFMRDRGNQVTLGAFISTFIYCLIVLRTVQNPGAPSDTAEGVAGSIPHIALLGAGALTLFNVGVLIFFIHHIPDMLRISTIIARVFRELLLRIDEQYPKTEDPEKTAKVDSDIDPHAPSSFEVLARRDGYVQYLDTKHLLQAAQEHAMEVTVLVQPGDYITRKMPLMRASGSNNRKQDIDEALVQTLALGDERTAQQDIRFLFQQLVEVAVRALSPGINDPLTAMHCLDRIQSALVIVANRRDPRIHYCADSGAVRLTVKPVTFAQLVDVALVQYLPYATHDRNARLHLMKVVTNTFGLVTNEMHRATLKAVADRLMATCEPLSLGAYDSVDLKRAKAMCDSTFYDSGDAQLPTD